MLWLCGELDVIEECSSRLGSVHIHPLLKLINWWWISLAEMLVHQESVLQVSVDLEWGGVLRLKLLLVQVALEDGPIFDSRSNLRHLIYYDLKL